MICECKEPGADGTVGHNKIVARCPYGYTNPIEYFYICANHLEHYKACLNMAEMEFFACDEGAEMLYA